MEGGQEFNPKTTEKSQDEIYNDVKELIMKFDVIIKSTRNHKFYQILYNE